MNATSGMVLWEGESISLDRVLRVRVPFTEPMEGVNGDNFDSVIFLATPGKDFVQEQTEKDFRHELHLFRLELRRRPVLLERMTKRILAHGVLDKKQEDALADAFPNAKRKLESYASELELSQNWSSILGTLIPDALLESLVNSADMSSDETKGPGVLSHILNMVQHSDRHVAKMKGKQLIFLVGDTGSGKSTTASYLMNIKLQEESGPMGRAWGHRNVSGPQISPSWTASQTLYAQGFEVDDLGESYALVDSPGFDDTRGDAYRMVTGLSLDRAVAAASCIPSVVLTVTHSLISERRGQSLLELLTKLRGRFPGILSPKQFDEGHIDQGLHIIVTKSSGLNAEQIRAVENGAFAREALQHCQDNLERFKASLDSLVLKEHYKMWKTLHRLGSKKRIHVLDLRDRQQRKDLLQRFRGLKHGPCTKPEYGTSFQDPKSQKILEVYISVSANTWRRFIEKLVWEFPHLKNQTEARLQESRQEGLELIRKRDQENKTLTDNVKKWQDLKRDLDLHENSLDDLEHLDESQTKLEWENADRLSSECNRRLGASEANFAQEENATRRLQADIESLESKIDEWKSGTTKVNLWSCCDNSDNSDNMTLLEKCGDETQEKAFSELRDWDFGKCKQKTTVDKASYVGRVTVNAYVPKEYRLIPADKDQSERFQTLLSEEETFGKTVAKVSGEKYTLLARKASPDGRTIVVRFEFQYSGSTPYPHVQIVHIIPNIDFNEASLRNADAEMTDLLSKKARAEKAKSSAQADVKSLEKQCAQQEHRADQILQARELKGVKQRLKFAQEQLQFFEETSADFQIEVERLQNQTSALSDDLSNLCRKHAELAFTITRYYHKVVPSLVHMSEYVRQILSSELVNHGVFQELDSFLKVHEEANQTSMKEGGIVGKAEVVLAEYQKSSSDSQPPGASKMEVHVH